MEQKDKNKSYRQEHQRKVETKRQRVESNNKQIKELMEEQKIDEARGATYGAAVAIESDTFQISAAIKEIETKKKLELNIRCPCQGCFKRGHVTNRAKGCKYYGKTDGASFIEAIKEYLLEAYPDHYGELLFHRQSKIP